MKNILAVCTLSVMGYMMISRSYALFGFGDSNASLSTFVPASSVDDTSVNLAQSAIVMLSPWGLANEDRPTQWVDSQTLVSYDIISAVSASTNKTQTINRYMSDLSDGINQLTSQIQYYQSKFDEAHSHISECSASKKSSDAAVIEAINQDRLTSLESLITASVVAGQCEAQYRISSNAYQLVTAKYERLLRLLTKKQSLIEQHQSLIVQYPEVILNPEIIQELSQISSQF
jgi:hypothetical protein